MHLRLGGFMHLLVQNSAADVRVEPDQRSELHSQSLLGDIVEVLEEKKSWQFCRLFDGSTGWIHCGYLVNKTSLLEKYTHGELLTVTKPGAFAFAEPLGNSQVLRPLSVATRLASLTYKNSWYHVQMPDNTEGWVYRHFISPSVELSQPSGQKIVDLAMQLRGIPYLWGGTSSFALDCSGFTQLLHRSFNITLPRNSSQQAQMAPDGEKILELDSLKPGDLLFFSEGASIDHVGIFSGEGKMIHAAMGNGEVKQDSLSGELSAYQQKLVSMFSHAVRIIGQ